MADSKHPPAGLRKADCKPVQVGLQWHASNVVASSCPSCAGIGPPLTLHWRLRDLAALPVLRLLPTRHGLADSSAGVPFFFVLGF